MIFFKTMYMKFENFKRYFNYGWLKEPKVILKFLYVARYR